MLSETGAPTPVTCTRLRPPASLMGPLDPAQQQAAVTASDLLDDYGTPVDRESAYEGLLARVAPPAPHPQDQARDQPRDQTRHGSRPPDERSGRLAGLLASDVVRSFARAAASTAGREITRSLFGTATRRRRRTAGDW